jgi:hypothetical protein
MTRPGRALIGSVLVPALGTAGCSAGARETPSASAPRSPAPSPSTSHSAGESSPPATLYGDGHSGDYDSASIDIIGLERTAQDAVTARIRITAQRDPVRLEGFSPAGLAGSTPYDSVMALSGFFLLDDPGFAVYYR